MGKNLILVKWYNYCEEIDRYPSIQNPMLEKINQKNAPKEVINALISLYNKGELEQILKN